jgi:hypothetical protein
LIVARCSRIALRFVGEKIAIRAPNFCLPRSDFSLRTPLAARRNPLAGVWNSVEQLVFISISINKCLTI